MAVPVGHGCSRSDQPQWNYKDLKNCHNVWPPFQPSNLPTFQPFQPHRRNFIKSKIKALVPIVRASSTQDLQTVVKTFHFVLDPGFSERKLRGRVYSPDKPQFRIILVLLLFQKFPAPASAENRHPSKLLPVVDRDPEDSHKSEQIFSPACQKVPNIRKVPQKMYKNSKRHLGTIIDHVLKELEK